MFNWIKTLKESVKDKWSKFEAWVNGWFPGAKTYITTGLGVIGSAAAYLQQYVTGLPVTKYITAETMALVTAGLFTLSFWFRGLGERVQERKED